MCRLEFISFFLFLALHAGAQNYPTFQEALKNQMRYPPVIAENQSKHVVIAVDTAFAHAGYTVAAAGFKTSADGARAWFEIEFKGGGAILRAPVALVFYRYNHEPSTHKAVWLTRANTPTGTRCQIEFLEPLQYADYFVLVPDGPFSKPDKKTLKKPAQPIWEGFWQVGDRQMRYPLPGAAVEEIVVDEMAPMEEDVVVEDVKVMEAAPESAPAAKPAAAPDPDGNRLYEIFDVQKPPTFPGGDQEMMQFLMKNIQYPVLARENGIQGRVMVHFIVEKDGTINDASILRDIGGGCGKEALRLLKSMPKWTPAEYNGRPVRCSYTMPVAFRLE